MSEQYALVGDIGGTNARLALCELSTGTISDIVTYPAAEYESLEVVMRQYLDRHDTPISSACIAIACPVTGDWVSMTNHHWEFSIQELKSQLNLQVLEVINDFTAVSFAIPSLKPEDRVQIGGGEAIANKPIAVYGAGTGLGVAQLIHGGNLWHSVPGEGGHVDLAACTPEEDDLIVYLRNKFGRVSAERCLSGQGIRNIYDFVVSHRGAEPEDYTPAKITEKALKSECKDCERALYLFCILMGRFGGNLALTNGSFGGVYIAGGIVPKVRDLFIKSGFRVAFEDKGRFKEYLQSIPVFLITHSEPGLLGAGTYIRQSLNISIN
ncbi:glucokinase [Vibrio natriegens]|uniref:glucokinase n=1 Tax=Vibrio natriegens TaxID=691 RepID=UPI003B58CC76